MKKIYYILAIISALSVVSCENYLDAPPQSTLGDAVIFSQYDLAVGAVNGIKISFGETNSHRGRFIPWYGMNTDAEFYTNSHQYPDNKADLAVYAATANNSQMNSTNNAWAKFYEGIERANICIEGLREYANLEDEKMAYLLGEAIVLRAIYYHDLIKAWGDVVYRFEPISNQTMYLDRSSRDQVYEQLLKDLLEVQNYLPWAGESSLTATTENVSKDFAKGLRAKFALMAAGYGQRMEDKDYLAKSKYFDKTALYTIAKEECLSLIAKKGTSLMDFETIFKNNCNDDITAGKESLWEIPFADGRGRVLFTFAVKHDGADQHTLQGGKGGTVSTPPNLFYDFADGDLRRDVTCIPYTWGAADKETGLAKQELANAYGWQLGKYRYEWCDRDITSTNDDGINKIYMRYAEVLLMAAEAVNELEGPANAKQYLQAVRARAFSPENYATNVTNYIAAINTKEDMLKAIQDEHKFEFAGEFFRKEALIRWGILGSSIKETKERSLALLNRTGDYANVPNKISFRYVDDPTVAGDDKTILNCYGFNRGENNPSPIYDNDGGSAKTWIPAITDTSYKTYEERVQSIYVNEPDEYQYWPLWQVFLDNSNGTLVNFYNY